MIFLLNLGLREDVAVSVNRKSMNKKEPLRMYFSGFNFLPNNTV